MTQDYEAVVRRLVADLFDLPPEEVGPDSSPLQISAWDSMQHFNLVLALEHECGVQLGPEHIERMTSVKDIVRILTEVA